MYYVDTETCGLHGMAVLIQYAKDEGDIEIHEVWRTPIYETLHLIERFLDEGIIGFNLAFDVFHLCKLYTTLSMFRDQNALPADHIDEIAVLEEKARGGPCLRFRHAMDLMLHARKGPYQTLMARNDIKIRKVPTPIAYLLAQELEKRVHLDDILFAARANKYAPQWSVADVKNPDGTISPDFKNVVLKFAPSGALKTLAQYALGAKNIIRHDDLDIPDRFWPEECGWAPFALAVAKGPIWKTKDGGLAWPAVIPYHIGQWAFNEKRRQYAQDDITYTRGLYHHFGDPRVDDDDSVLACMVGAVRWSGFDIDIEGLKRCRDTAAEEAKTAPKSPRHVKNYILAAMSEVEKISLIGSTSKQVLEKISKWHNGDQPHPAAIRAQKVLSARKAKKRQEVCEKLIQAGRFHASFSVIGALSTRMAGRDGLNPQGIDHSDAIRSLFLFCNDDMLTLCGGDFDSQEITLADAVYQDPAMHQDLVSGVKLHAVMGSMLYDKPIEEVKKSKGSSVFDMYSAGKQGNFLLIYGGDAGTFERRIVGVTLETGEMAFRKFFARYPVFGQKRKMKLARFCSMTQPGGIGTKVIWQDAPDYAESLFGFKRFFTLENRICKALFEIANQPPRSWREINIKVQRRERIQTASGAAQSALYAAAFGLQASNMRAALNHEIQASGAQITKKVQRNIWDLQPVGVGPFIVKPMNTHDEVNTPVRKGYEAKVKEVVDLTVESFKSKVPLLKMEWKIGLKNWSEK